LGDISQFNCIQLLAVSVKRDLWVTDPPLDFDERRSAALAALRRERLLCSLDGVNFAEPFHCLVGIKEWAVFQQGIWRH
jgi:hypothetical protein